MVNTGFKPRPSVLSSTTLIGDGIRNLQGEPLGSVKEIMLDLAHGRIMYVVMSVGGFLGLGERLFAVPWEALQVDTERQWILLDADEERLKEAAGFDKDDWPDFADPQFNEGAYKQFRVPPYWLDDDEMVRSGDSPERSAGGRPLH